MLNEITLNGCAIMFNVEWIWDNVKYVCDNVEWVWDNVKWVCDNLEWVWDNIK